MIKDSKIKELIKYCDNESQKLWKEWGKCSIYDEDKGYYEGKIAILEDIQSMLEDIVNGADNND